MMEDPLFTVKSRMSDDGALIVELVGELDLSTQPMFVEATKEYIADTTIPCLIFEMSGLDFIDSEGLRCLIGCYRQLKEEGRNLLVVQPPNRVRRVMEMTGLQRFFTLYDSLEQALSVTKITS